MSALAAATTRQLVDELESRGFDVDEEWQEATLRDVDTVELERLAELIALGRTDEALQALHDIAPEAPRPATIRTILAARAAEATAKASS